MKDFTMLMGLMILCGAVNAIAGEAAPPVAKSLFDGTSLTDWEFDPQWWRVADGAIVGEIPAGQTLKRNQFIFWKGEMHDFDLTAEYRLTGGPGANSGIQFRSVRRPDGTAVGYQADIDDRITKTGRIYEEEARAELVKRGSHVTIAEDGKKTVEVSATPESFKAAIKVDDWNTYRIRAVGTHIELWVNGSATAVLDDHQTGAAALTGRLGLQLHMAAGPVKIEYRKIVFTDLGRSEAPTSR